MTMAKTPGDYLTALPAGIRSRFVDNGNGLNMHVLEAGFETKNRPCVLLLHGFPELAFSWRYVMPALAAAGFYVIAPDQRGYGRTTGWDPKYDGDLRSFGMFNLVRDTIGLLFALGYRGVVSVVGHDFGSPVAAWCSLIRPDVFRSTVLMSAPFGGTPTLPFDTTSGAGKGDGGGWPAAAGIDVELAKLTPPRKHYHWYYSTREADANMHRARQGVHDFMRAYYHYKSADWKLNKPYRLESWSAVELAKMPTYYIMNRDEGMAETAAAHMPSAAEIAACKWLPDDDLAVYSAEYERNGFQGGLQWYRCRTSGMFDSELQVFSGRTIDVPACFIAGKSDWGVYQKPGDLENMSECMCTQWHGTHLVEGAGHWVQQEQAGRVNELLLRFLREV
jgi:pimeloyl-ACP methyl ester carboxylesterase